MENKKPGFYSSYLNVEEIQKMNEFELYLKIYETENKILKYRADKAMGNITKESLVEEEFALEYLRYQTIKFGVEISLLETDSHLILSKSYYAWYGFYNNYFMSILTEEERNLLQKLIKDGSDISDFYPEPNWKSLLEGVNDKNANYSYDDLLNVIKQRCDSEAMFEYIEKSLFLIEQNNNSLFTLISKKLYEVLLKYPTFKIVIDKETFVNIYEYFMAFTQKDISGGNYLIFVHEVTHLIHGIYGDYECPSEYNPKLINLQNSPLLGEKVINLMRKIIEEKQQYYNGVVEGKIKNGDKVSNEILKKINNIKNRTYKIDNLKEVKYKDFKDGISLNLTFLDQINSDLDFVFDNFSNRNIPPYYQTLTHLEGIIDSILMGKIKDGVKIESSLIRGYGHTKEYFSNNPFIYSFIELIADYVAIISFNDDKMIESIKNILGNDMVCLLDSYVYKYFGYNLDYKEERKQ